MRLLILDRQLLLDTCFTLLAVMLVFIGMDALIWISSYLSKETDPLRVWFQRLPYILKDLSPVIATVTAVWLMAEWIVRGQWVASQSLGYPTARAASMIALPALVFALAVFAWFELVGTQLTTDEGRRLAFSSDDTGGLLLRFLPQNPADASGDIAYHYWPGEAEAQAGAEAEKERADSFPASPQVGLLPATAERFFGLSSVAQGAQHDALSIDSLWHETQSPPDAVGGIRRHLEYRYSLAQRVVVPFIVLGLVFLAVVLSTRMPLHWGESLRRVMGIVGILLFYVANEFITTLGRVAGVTPEIAVLLPVLGLVVVSVILYRRT